MLTIKLEPKYDVTVGINIDGQDRTVTTYGLNETETEKFGSYLNKEALTPFLEYRFQRSFCEGLVDIPLRQAQEAQLLKEHIAKSFVPADPDAAEFELDEYFNQVFVEVADNLQEEGLVKIYHDFYSDNIRMIEPTKVGRALIQLLFGE